MSPLPRPHLPPAPAVRRLRREVSRRISLGLSLSAVLILAWLPSAPATAQQQTSLHMHVQSRRVVMGDNLILQLTARGEFDDVTPPTSEGFDFRQTGRSSQMSVIGARVTRSFVLTYQGVPRRPGKWTVLGAVLKLRGKAVARTGNVTIDVLDGRAALGPAIEPAQAGALARYRNEQFFVQPVFSTDQPFVGQPVVVTYALYWVRGASVQGIRELSEPVFTGFEVEDLLKGQPQRQQQVRVGGRLFYRQVTRKMLVIAPAAGKYEVFGPRYQVTVGDLFDSRQLKIGPPPVRLTIRAVPEAGRPKSYREDAIGHLSLRVHLLERGQPTTSVHIKTGERAVLVYEVSGRGNLLSLPDMKPPAVRGMTVTPLPARADAGVKRTAHGVEGKRTWQYLIAFDSAGQHQIPATTWSHFDPQLGRFETTRVEGLQVDVAPSPGDPAAAGAARAGADGHHIPGSPQTAGATGADRHKKTPLGAEANTATRTAALTPSADGLKHPLVLRGLAPTAALAQTAHQRFTQTGWFWWTAGAPWLGALLLLILWLLRRRRAQREPARAVQSALTDALTALTDASDHAGLHAAVAGYLSTRANIRLAGLTSRSLLNKLESAGVDTATSAALVTQLEHCDYARFAPGGGDDELRSTGRQIGDVLRAIDDAVAATARQPRRGGSKRSPSGRHVNGALLLLLPLSVLASVVGVTRDAQAVTLDQSFQAANAAFASDDLAVARRGYEALLSHGLQVAAVHYNLGNVLTQMDHLGEAVGHYRQAQRLAPEEPLRSDIAYNLTLVRHRLGERARRNHRVLHVFDESPELDVAVARAAPRRTLGITLLATGAVALVLFGVALFGAGATARSTLLRVGIAAALVVYGIAGAWLWQAQHVDQTVRHAVVVQEDAWLTPCTGDGERLDLPEGLEVRIVRQRPDGRIETRLPNGRTGCLTKQALVTIAETTR